MTETQIWLIIAIVLFILEIITPGFVLANFGVAAIAAAGAAWFGGSMTVQVIVFVVVCIISFFTVRPLLKRTILKGSKTEPTGTNALIGRETRVSEQIPVGPETGRVHMDGDSWRAASVDNSEIEVGAVVRVVRVVSTTLFVQRV